MNKIVAFMGICALFSCGTEQINVENADDSIVESYNLSIDTIITIEKNHEGFLIGMGLKTKEASTYFRFNKYSEDGNLESTSFYFDEGRSGKTVQFWPNGNIKSEINLLDGLKNGLSYSIDINGDTIYKNLYEKGVKVY